MNEASKHWSLLRAAALPMIPLFFYFVTQLEYLTTRSRDVFIGWVKQPETTACLLLFILCAFYHGSQGIGEIIEDYVPPGNIKTLSLRLNQAFFFILGGGCFYAVLAISFGKF